MASVRLDILVGAIAALTIGCGNDWDSFVVSSGDGGVGDVVQDALSDTPDETTSEASVPVLVDVLVPLYIDPTSDPAAWQKVSAAQKDYPNVQVIVIVNPFDGPGIMEDPVYTTAIGQLTNAGVKVAGYVYTSYGERQMSQVKADIHDYREFYPKITALFVDEMSNEQSTQKYYNSIGTYARNIEKYSLVIGKPGTDIPTSFIGMYDSYVIYAESGLPSTAFLQGWHTSYDRHNFAFLAFDIPSIASADFTKRKKYVGYAYITDDRSPNPWDTLPPYFHKMVRLLAE